MAKKPENEMLAIIDRKIKEFNDYHRGIQYERDRIRRENIELDKELGRFSFRLRDEIRKLIGMEGRKCLQVIGSSWERKTEYPDERYSMYCHIFIEWNGFETSRVDLSINEDMDITVSIPSGLSNTFLIKKGDNFVFANDLATRISFEKMAEMATKAILESARVKK